MCSSSENSEIARPTKPGRVKRSRPATIFDVTNFEWVLEMSLRRPRAFVGLYKTMKSQYRVLEKRRWVEKNRKLYDRAQFEKFLKETSHSEVEMIEKTKLLKAEKDMELALGVKRADAQRMERFAVKDLAHWYGMSARYAVQADALAKKTLEEAKMIDVALEKLKQQEAEAEKERRRAAEELAIHNTVWGTVRSIVQRIEDIEYEEIEKERMEMIAVKNTLIDMVSHIERDGLDDAQDHPVHEIVEILSSTISECDADASETGTVVSMSTDDVVVKEEPWINKWEHENPFSLITCLDLVDKECSTISDKRIPPIIHMQSHIPITSAFISVILKLDIHFKLYLPFEPRFKRPRRVDRELDLLPPGDFSPYSTDEEWEEYYEKKERFENHDPLMHQLSWSSYGRDEDDGDDYVSGPIGQHHCDCAAALDRAKDWVSDLTSMPIRRCYSEEVLPKCSDVPTVPTRRAPARCHSALSCLSLEQVPILEAPVSGLVPIAAEPELEKPRRRSSLSLPLKSDSSLQKRSASMPASWKPTVHLPFRNVSPSSLCESRRERYMYPRALSGYRFRVYGVGELLTSEPRRSRRRGHRELEFPDQWVKRDERHRHDFLKSARFWLEDRTQRSIPVVWYSRPDRSVSRFSHLEDPDMEKDDQNVQVMPTVTERRDCPLKHPIPVYNPLPTWTMLADMSQGEKQNDTSSERLEPSSSEPSAFQPVLQRPQPIDLNALEVELETDDESDEKMPKWPLLKKLREAERELLAAGNPIALERQKIREYNRHLRAEMVQGQDLLEEQLRQMHQLYLEYFAAQQLILAQDLDGSILIGGGRTMETSLVLPLVSQTTTADSSLDCNEGESLIEVLHVDPDEIGEEQKVTPCTDANKDVPMEVGGSSECVAGPETTTSADEGVEPNSVEERGSTEPTVTSPSVPAALPRNVVSPSSDGQTRIPSDAEKLSGGDGNASSLEL
ncbi:hypothetical protein COOONC_00042 [Cooperia oncophora]